MGDILKFIFGIIFFFLTVVGILFSWSIIMALPVKWLWNYIVPSLFNLREINYLEALAMLLLSGLLFRANVTKKVEKEK